MFSQTLPSTEYSYNRDYPFWQLEDLLYPLFNSNHTQESLSETIKSANHIWCAYQNEQCLGCGLMTEFGSQKGLYLLLFGVRRSFQGQGIGTQLLQKIVQWARQRHFTFIYLHTEKDNRKAITMYQKAGFLKQHCDPQGLDDLPSTGSDSISMILYL